MEIHSWGRPAMPDRKLKVFLCHASQDKPIVRELYKKLLAEDWIDPWLDEERLLPGQDWNREIARAVEASEAVIICLSTTSVAKEGYVQKELRRVLEAALEKPEGSIFIIPLRLDECEAPYSLRTYQALDYFPQTQREKSTKRLFEALKVRAGSLNLKPVPGLGAAARPESVVSSRESRSSESNAAHAYSILFLAADPSDMARLRLGEELREIQEKLQLSRLRDQFNLQQRMSVRPVDISQALLDVQPQIVHFSGHGLLLGELCFENQDRTMQPIPPDALAALFEQFSEEVECVILNACYSVSQAQAISAHIDYVIGMDRQIGDRAAIAFAIGFYQALGAGRTIEAAYKLGCVQIRLYGIQEHLTPVLLKRGDKPA
jgi:hypothetical protein